MPGARRVAVVLLLSAGCAGVSNVSSPDPASSSPQRLRVALFNVEELSAAKVGERDEAGAGINAQLRAAAAILQRVRPDVLVLQEVDQVADEAQSPESLTAVARGFAAAYLSRGPHALDLPHSFAAPTNTGLLTGIDLNGDGVTATARERGTREHGDDSFGFGVYPGQYSMAVLSRYPLEAARARTFQRLLWKDLPGNHLPAEFFSSAARGILRLSSKSHWDVPVRVGESTVHLWISHPTPPAFDGPEDRNGRRNFDEIRFWRLYLDGEPALYDDHGVRGGYAAGEPFLIVGDLNASPDPAESLYDGKTAMAQLLEHPRIQDSGSACTSEGGRAFARAAGSQLHPERITAQFLGGRRVDYLLPSTELRILDGGVFWPAESPDPDGAALASQASDHRLVWLDLELKATP